MPGPLQHCPADVVAQLIVDLGFGEAFDSGLPWSTFVDGEPDTPDDCVTIYDTSGLDEGRAMATGERQEHHGVQVRVRSSDKKVGSAKARAIAVGFDQSVANTPVSVDGVNYLVAAVTRQGDPLSLGKDGSRSKRSLHTLNCLVSLREYGELGSDAVLLETGGFILLDLA